MDMLSKGTKEKSLRPQNLIENYRQLSDAESWRIVFPRKEHTNLLSNT